MCYCKQLRILKNRSSNLRGLSSNVQLAKRCLTSKVKLYGWGSCDAGELGDLSKSTNITSPVLLDIADKVGLVSCGYGTTFVTKATQSGTIAFGLNSVGQLGTKEGSSAINIDLPINQIACGRSHSLLLSSSGVYAAGANVQGQCGLLDHRKFIPAFEKVPLTFDHKLIKQVACGLDHSLVLTTDGKVFSTGLGADGQTGAGQYDCQYGFKEVVGEIKDLKVTQISTSTDTCLALTDTSAVFGWGNNELGQISGKNSEKQVAIPTLVDKASKFKDIKQVFAGGSFSAIVADGKVYVTGYGSLGLGEDEIEVCDYHKVSMRSEFGKVSRLSGGPDYLAALTDTGSLLTWGRGNHGRLGHGGTADMFTPRRVPLPGRVVDFSCGIDHMVALVDEDTNVDAGPDKI